MEYYQTKPLLQANHPNVQRAVRNHQYYETDKCRWSFLSKTILLICILLFFVSLLFVGYLCPDRVCALSSGSLSESRYETWSKFSLKNVIKDNMARSIGSLASHPLRQPFQSASFSKLSFDEIMQDPSFVFDIKGDDVMVFLHIQKTGMLPFKRPFDGILIIVLRYCRWYIVWSTSCKESGSGVSL